MPSAPGPVTVGPSLDVRIVDPNLLPDWPSTPANPAAGPINPDTGQPYVNKTIHPIVGAAGLDSVRPNSNPAIPHILAEVNYKPLTAAKLGAPIFILYGRVRTGGNLIPLKQVGVELLCLMIWGEGECQAIDKIYSDENSISFTAGDTVIANYTGTQAQTADSYVAAQMGHADAQTGICYSVLKLAPAYSLNLTAVIRGKKVWDPRSSTTAYSTNPALCLADFIDSYTDHEVDWDSVEYAADYCDDIIVAPSTKRWELGMVLADAKDPDEWISVLAEYANCFVFYDNGVAKLLPDEPRDVDLEITGGDIRAGSFDLRKSGQRDSPTQVFCDYLLPDAANVWNDASAYTADPDESQPLRITRLKMGGFFRAVHAQRKANQFQNYANIADLAGTFEMTGKGAQLTKGDVVSITHPVGLTAKEFRVLDANAVAKGRWRIEVREYSPLLSSTEVVADPNVSDTNLPAIDNVPTPANMVLTESLYQIASGETRAKLKASVDAVTYPFRMSYEWIVMQGTATLFTQTTSAPSMVWGPLPLSGAVTYLVKCRVHGQVSDGAYLSKEINVLGKTALPLPPSSFTPFEAGGTVYFRWGAGMDIDLAGYEIRYGTSGQIWAEMTVVNRWGLALAGDTRLIAPGTWTFEIRSFDTVKKVPGEPGQYSATGLRAEVPVTTDADAFHVSDHDLTYDGAASSNMRLVKGTYWTDTGESWSDVFGADPLTGKSNPIITYLADTDSNGSEWISEVIDMGQVLSMLIAVSPMAEAISGTISTSIEVKTDIGDSWTTYTQESVKATARYVRVVYHAGSTSRMMVGPDTYGSVSIDVVANSLKGDVSTDGLGPTTVDMGVPVARFRYLEVSVIGTGIKVAKDNLVTGDPGTFDVHFLDEDTNAEVEADGYWLAYYY